MTHSSDFDRREQESILRQAVIVDDVARINLELTDILPGVSVDSFFHQACEVGSLGAMQALLPECADPISADSLQAASENDHWEAVKFLLPRLPENAIIKSGVLSFSSWAGAIDVVRILIKNYPAVIADSGFLAIQQAADQNHMEMLKALLAQVSLEGLAEYVMDSKFWSVADAVGSVFLASERVTWMRRFPEGVLPRTLALMREEKISSVQACLSKPRHRS